MYIRYGSNFVLKKLNEQKFNKKFEIQQLIWKMYKFQKQLEFSFEQKMFYIFVWHTTNKFEL